MLSLSLQSTENCCYDRSNKTCDRNVCVTTLETAHKFVTPMWKSLYFASLGSEFWRKRCVFFTAGCSDLFVWGFVEAAALLWGLKHITRLVTYLSLSQHVSVPDSYSISCWDPTHIYTNNSTVQQLMFFVVVVVVVYISKIINQIIQHSTLEYSALSVWD